MAILTKLLSPLFYKMISWGEKNNVLSQPVKHGWASETENGENNSTCLEGEMRWCTKGDKALGSVAQLVEEVSHN